MILEILAHTPAWVFALFTFLLVLGWQQSRSRTVKLSIIFILPLGMLLLSYFGVISSFGLRPTTISLWFTGLLLATGLGFYLLPVNGASYNPHASKYKIPGSWLPLALMMGIFFSKYLAGVLSALNPDLMEQNIVIYAASLLYGGFSGIFLARAISILGAKRTTLNARKPDQLNTCGTAHKLAGDLPLYCPRFVPVAGVLSI